MKMDEYNFSNDYIHIFAVRNLKDELQWKYIQSSEFNELGTLILVSGVHNPRFTDAGEIVVFEVDCKFTLILLCTEMDKVCNLFQWKIVACTSAVVFTIHHLIYLVVGMTTFM